MSGRIPQVDHAGACGLAPPWRSAGAGHSVDHRQETLGIEAGARGAHAVENPSLANCSMFSFFTVPP